MLSDFFENELCAIDLIGNIPVRSRFGPQSEGQMRQGPRVAGGCRQADNETEGPGAAGGVHGPEFGFLLFSRAH